MAVRQEANRRGELRLSRPSPRTDVAKLIETLDSGDADIRAAAVARLRVIGSRAIARLADIVADTSRAASTRAAAVSALDGVSDPRAVDVALGALAASETEVVVTALAVLRDWVTRERGTRILEALTLLALDKTRNGPIRLAALDALSDLPRALVEPLIEHGPADDSAGQGIAGLDDATALRAWLTAHESTAPLSALHDALVKARDAERAAADRGRAQEWLSVRGALHAALAGRGSRIALYDLREAFERAATPLPADFVTAIARVGDATCLEPLARAWAVSRAEPWWHTRVAESAADLRTRLKLSSRHAVLKRVRDKWPGFL